MTGRRSAGSRANDERILDAALAEIVEVGVDRLGMSPVARRAGLTTGALYGRYENVAELAAAVWAERVRDPHRTILDVSIRALVDHDSSADLRRIAAEIAAPSDTTIVALELLATARRIDELDELIRPDVAGWVREWGAGPKTRRRHRRAQVLLTLGIVWGACFHVSAASASADWARILTTVKDRFALPTTERRDRLDPGESETVRADTGDASTDALIDSVAAVVARVGLERATATRIARRAGVTSGAIYSHYRSKEDLVAHAVDVMVAKRFTDDIPADSHTLATTLNPGVAIAEVVSRYLAPPRHEWLKFRIEVQLAARHHPALAATIERIQDAAGRMYVDATEPAAAASAEPGPLQFLLRAAVPGLAFTQLVVGPGLRVDWRPVFEHLGSLF